MEKIIGGKVKKMKKEKIKLAKKLKRTLKMQKLGFIVKNIDVKVLGGVADGEEGSVMENVEEGRIESKKKEDAQEVTEKRKAKRKRKKKVKQKEASLPKKQKVSADAVVEDSSKGSETAGSKISTADMSPWKNLFVPPLVLKALEEQGFTCPTPIQSLTLPSAIRDRKDIVGAAETGSGKTLAFGIPVIHHILRLKEAQAKKDMVGDTELAGEDEDMSDEDEEEDISDVSDADDDDKDIGGASDDDENDGEDIGDEEDADVPESDDDVDNEEDVFDDDDDDEAEGVDSDGNLSEPERDEVNWEATESATAKARQAPLTSRLFALVLTPTRELAIQVKNHLQAVAKYTGIKIATVVGGMSQQKQERILKKCPEIVVATPGRLWELIQEDNPHLLNVASLPLLVIDEADRMVEKGHFQELASLFEMINTDDNQKRKRQNFIFSATLTYVHQAPMRLMLKKKKKKRKQVKSLSQTDKLDALVSQVGLRDKPKVVDITRKVGTVDTLMEARINCTNPEKDIYLYYFLQQFPGRTLIFVNSKDCLRRLVSIMTLLKCPPLPLHADMHQRQRLKNLDRFTGNPKGILLATDVAARGLDIPNVQHVLHYQVPYTTENYIHRSGRTARATKEGLSVMIVGPEDIKNYRKIIKSLNRDEDLPLFPINDEILPAIHARVELARKIDVEEHRVRKANHSNNWFKKAAEEMDIELDEDLLEDTGSREDQRHHKDKLKMMRADLNAVLKASLIPRSFSGKYPTKSGKLVLPHTPSTEESDAISRVRKDTAKHKKLVAKESKRVPVVKKIEKKKFKKDRKRNRKQN
ncbi:ATP-dependent RNA helicase DDX24-like isoform X2 [Lineus longissimus]